MQRPAVSPWLQAQDPWHPAPQSPAVLSDGQRGCAQTRQFVAVPPAPVLTALEAGCKRWARSEEKHPHHGGQQDKVPAELMRPSLEPWGGKGPSPPGSPGSPPAPAELGPGQAEPRGAGRSRGSWGGGSCSFSTASAPAGLKQGEKLLCHPPGQPLHQPASKLQSRFSHGSPKRGLVFFLQV